jgi:aldose 1-epimerase
MPVSQRLFGHLRDQRPVHSIVLGHDSGFAVEVLEYGATLRAIHVPGSQGELLNTILSYDTLTAYESDQVYLGALVGRCANRIANGVAMVNQARYQLSRHQGPHHLHGGKCGFSRQLWRTVEQLDGEHPGVVLEHCSADGDEGYPGSVLVRVTFTIAAPLSLHIAIRAIADCVTPLNCTLHPYFNLNGGLEPLIDNHELFISADSFLENSRDGIPTGRLIPVADTPFDFRHPQNVGAGLTKQHLQLRLRGGYDHYFILDGKSPAATLFSPTSGIELQLRTNQRGFQFHSGSQLRTGTGGVFADRAGLCLEPHGYPNAVNEPGFPGILIQPQQEYSHLTEMQFSVLPSRTTLT